ncbi:MAG: urocanate hydratase [Halobacteriales archaeon]|nr:urocanate hydratase [Halobacteriales archaeon]
MVRRGPCARMALRLQAPYRAPRGPALHCKGWRQEAFLRLLLNNLENAERPEELIVYGGTGKAARSPDALRRIVRALRALGDEETLLVQSGKPVGIIRTHEDAPRVLFANSNLVPAWANWEHFRGLERAGLMMYGQMTAGCWSYIGAQGIIQGTYETFAAAARRHFRGSLRGKLVLTGGLGGMGGAQPLAAKMAGAACIAVEVDPSRIARRQGKGFVDHATDSLDEALRLARDAMREGRGTGIALLGNCAETHPELLRRGIVPDVVTDQTSAHDALQGYVPAIPLEDALALRRDGPAKYTELSMRAMAQHCKAILAMQAKGAVAFDYGNNLRGQARKAGVSNAFDYPGFVQAYIRPMFCEGRGPFRWLALGGEPDDILATDRQVLRMFPKDKLLRNWIDLAEEHLPWEGLPARVCWLGLGERDRFAKRMNDMVRAGKLQAPIAITRDHLDTGSVASPYRETEGMKDGTDAVADWPILNALTNVACGADMVAVHGGGGVGIGLSQHAGMTVVADGSAGADRRIRRVFVADPALGVLRHLDAGYAEAGRAARRHWLRVP